MINYKGYGYLILQIITKCIIFSFFLQLYTALYKLPQFSGSRVEEVGSVDGEQLLIRMGFLLKALKMF